MKSALRFLKLENTRLKGLQAECDLLLSLPPLQVPTRTSDSVVSPDVLRASRDVKQLLKAKDMLHVFTLVGCANSPGCLADCGYH